MNRLSALMDPRYVGNKVEVDNEVLQAFRRNNGTTLAVLGHSKGYAPTMTYTLRFSDDVSDRERELFREYLDSCFEEAARAVADCVEQGIRGVGR